MIVFRARTRALLALAAWASLALGAAGCGARGGDAKPHLRLAMVTDTGGLGDKSFNDSAYAGLTAAKKLLDADVTVLESKSAADYQPNLTVLADEEYDEIYAIGFLMSKDVESVARHFPKRHFALIDATVEQPNVSVRGLPRTGRCVSRGGARGDGQQDRTSSVSSAEWTFRCCADSKRAIPRARVRSIPTCACW